MTVLIVFVAMGLWLAVVVFILALCHAAAAAGDRLVEMACSDVRERALEINHAAVTWIPPERRVTASRVSRYTSTPLQSAAQTDQATSGVSP